MALELLEVDSRAVGAEARPWWRVVELVESLAGPAFLVRERARLLPRRLVDGSGEVIAVCAALDRLEAAEFGEDGGG